MSNDERRIYELAPVLLLLGGGLAGVLLTGRFLRIHAGIALPVILLVWIVAVWVGAFYVADVVRRTRPRLPAAILGLSPLVLVLGVSCILLYRVVS